jgi:acetylornithine deacetylase
MTESTKLLRELVSLPSVNPMGRDLKGPELFEHRVTAYLEDFFRKLEVPYERQPVAPQRENIVARYEAPGTRRTVMFEAHQDTVPTDHMVIDPFGAKIEGGRLYGRGACDIKGGLSAMLTAFARIVREKPAGAPHLLMACTVDEEHTMLGVRRLVEDFGRPAAASPARPDMAVVAEPTQLNIVNAHKGIVRWHAWTRGRSCHSSSPEQGINAIYRMARLLAAIEQFADQLRASRADPLLGPPTLSVGRIEGGTSVNTVPDWCRIEIDRRVIPGEDPRALPQQVQEFLRQKLDFPFEFDQPWAIKPALGPERSAELVERLGRAIDAVVGRHRVMGVPYGTDAAVIAEAGVPVVVFGPGDIAQAHTCDEWVLLEQVEQASEILYRLACAA